jgi:hypothetical protein
MTDAERLEAYRATHGRRVATVIVPGQKLGVEIENATLR